MVNQVFVFKRNLNRKTYNGVIQLYTEQRNGLDYDFHFLRMSSKSVDGRITIYLCLFYCHVIQKLNKREDI